LTLGESLPQDLLEEAIRRQLMPGAVIRYHTTVTTPPKPKWFLVVCLQPFTCLIINSDIPRYYQFSARHMLADQVELKVVTEPCNLDNDCWLDCTKLYSECTFDEMYNRCCSHDAQIKGRLSSETIRTVMDVVDDSYTLTQVDKNLILSNLSP
jgi:hypothetical protein